MPLATPTTSSKWVDPDPRPLPPYHPAREELSLSESGKWTYGLMQAVREHNANVERNKEVIERAMAGDPAAAAELVALDIWVMVSPAVRPGGRRKCITIGGDPPKGFDKMREYLIGEPSTNTERNDFPN